MNEQIVARILEERAQNPNTYKAYKATYNKMAKFEGRSHQIFESGNRQLVFDFISDPSSKYDDISSVSSALPHIKCYLREIGWSPDIEELSCRDFDISATMRAALVESLEEIYQRGFLLYSPDNGDAFFPLVSFAWMGLSSQEAMRLPDSAVDLANGTIDTQSTLIFSRMPPNMIHTLQQYQNASQSCKPGNGQIKLPDRTGSFIYKTSFAGSSSTGKAMDKTTYSYYFTRIKEAYNEGHTLQTQTTYGNVVQSAKYFKARQMELAGTDWGDPRNSAALQQIFATQRLEAAYLRHNYQMYKKAFGLK